MITNKYYAMPFLGICIFSIGNNSVIADTPPITATNVSVQQWAQGKRVMRSKHISQLFDHDFRWPRHWYVWDIPPCYFWWGSKVYIYSPRKNWQETWNITNATPAPLLIRTADGITSIDSSTTVAIPRNGKKYFQFYSLTTGERALIHTRAPTLTIQYAPEQDYLITTPTNNQ